jgi:hypothetical protein
MGGKLSNSAYLDHHNHKHLIHAWPKNEFQSIADYLSEQEAINTAKAKPFKKPKVLYLDSTSRSGIVPMDTSIMDGPMLAIPVSANAVKKTLFSDVSDEVAAIPLLRKMIDGDLIGDVIIVNKNDAESDKEVTAFKRWLNQINEKKDKKDEGSGDD